MPFNTNIVAGSVQDAFLVEQIERLKVRAGSLEKVLIGLLDGSISPGDAEANLQIIKQFEAGK